MSKLVLFTFLILYLSFTKTVWAETSTASINQKVLQRFDADINKLSAILEEEKSRQKVTETIVAFGRGETPLDSAAYYLNFAAEASAYQRIQEYAPTTGGKARLRGDLNILAGKILRAKTEIGKAIVHYEN